jgi:predicted DNA-binding antitoxin AbrB/MazE fold protein
MSLRIEATYEDGVLKLDAALPLKEHERVLVTIQSQTAQPQVSRTRQSYGLIGWTGDPQVLRQIAEDDECGVQESP